MDDVALGHTAKLRWNETDKWVWSEHIVHPPIIDREAFDQVQALPGGWASAHAEHKPHHAASLRIARLPWCGICERRMQSHWANSAPYYRCRFPPSTPWPTGSRTVECLPAHPRADTSEGGPDARDG